MTAEAHFVAEYGRVKAALAGADVAWLAAEREAAMARFRELGLPSTRLEAWRYTNLNPLKKLEFAPLNGAGEASPVTIEPGVARLVNGHFAGAGELPAGVRVDGLADLLAHEPAALAGRLGALTAPGDGVIALNAALMQDGVVLRVAPGARVDAPLTLEFAGSGGARTVPHFPRVLIVVGQGAALDLVERHGGTGAYLADGRAEIFLEPGARLRHVKLLGDDRAAFHLWSSQIEVAAGAAYDGFVLTAGGRISRQDIAVRLAGPGGRCDLAGAYLGVGDQVIDMTTLIDHAAPECTSREVFKGVLDDRARSVFQGTVQVRAGAQQTDSHQLSRALLLSDQAEANAKPALEILADDVKCGHGATAGELDDEALFYLRSRGIPEPAARGLLIEAFLADVIDGIAVAPGREAARAVLDRWLKGRF